MKVLCVIPHVPCYVLNLGFACFLEVKDKREKQGEKGEKLLLPLPPAMRGDFRLKVEKHSIMKAWDMPEPEGFASLPCIGAEWPLGMEEALIFPPEYLESQFLHGVSLSTRVSQPPLPISSYLLPLPS